MERDHHFPSKIKVEPSESSCDEQDIQFSDENKVSIGQPIDAFKSNSIPGSPIEDSPKLIKHEFKCRYCESGYSRNCDLVRHEKRKHPRIKKIVIKEVLRRTRDAKIQEDLQSRNASSNHSKDLNETNKLILRTSYPRRKKSSSKEIVKSDTDDDNNFGSEASNHSVESNEMGDKLVIDVPKTKKKRKSRLSESQLAAVARAKIVVGDRTLFHCNECGKNIMHQFSYLTHLRIHTGEKPFTCHVCGRQFRTASQLVRHVNDVHEGIKKHPCDICGRKFAHARARNEHRRTHTEERPCVCHLCGKAFRTKASLYVHNTFHMDVFKYQCPHCERQFRRRQELNDHIMIHTGEKPFACGSCTKSFRQRQELKRHLLTHSTEKPYECPTCKQRFSQKRYLRNHSKTHALAAV